MASKTPNLGLIKPARGEFQGTWDIPMNANSDALDASLGGAVTEITDARGSQSSLTARLDVQLNADGTLKDIPEVAAARISTVYGDNLATVAYTLDARVEQGDREVFDARQSLTTLNDRLAFNLDNDHVNNSVNSAPPGFLSFTGANVKVDGSVTPVVCDINGYRQVVRTLKQVVVSGAAGTRYVYLQRSSTGEIILNRTGGGDNTGNVAIYTGDGKLRKLNDTTQNFITSGAQPGDIVEITSVGSQNLGQYIVEAVIDANNLIVIGQFVTSQANLNYKITNPIAPSLLVTATVPAKRYARVSDQIFIGRAVFDGANVTSVMTYAVKGRYEAFTSITLTLGNFSQVISHNIGYVPTGAKFFASQANDYSQVIEPLSVADMTASTLQRSVIVKMDDTDVYVKNATNGIFYKSFDGVSQTAGYLLVIAER